MKTILKGVIKTISPVLALLAILLIVVVVQSFVDYKPDNIHYKGETILTIEELHELFSLKRDEDGSLEDIDNSILFYYKYEDVSIVFIYDFYSELEFNFLNKVGDNTYWDRPIIYNLREQYVESISEGWNSERIVILTLLALLLAGSYLATKNPKKTTAFLNKVLNSSYERLDSHYPLVDDYDIVDNFSKFKTSDCKGIICTRSWKPDKHGNLKSIIKQTVWKNNELCADNKPNNDDLFGIYGYRIASPITQKTEIMGIVEMDGKYQYHPDGVVRSEHCKILGLFIRESRPRLGRLLSNKYKVPVYFCKTAVEGYLDWLYSEYGIDSMQHNSKILEVKDGNRYNT